MDDLLGYFVSVIVPIRNEKEHIGRCLQSIVSQCYPQSKLEILVVDGMSNDTSREIVKQFAAKYSNIRLLDNPKRIVPTAMNIGIQNAKGDIILRVDGHSYLDPDYIAECVNYLEKTRADNVGGLMCPSSDSYVGRAIALSISSPFGVGNAKFHYSNQEGYVDTVYLGAYRRSVFNRIGLYDEELVRNQDDELNYRLIKEGGKIYFTPQIKAYYHPRQSLKALWKQYYQYGYWKVRVIQKHKMPASWRHLVPGSFVSVLLITGSLAFWNTIVLIVFFLVLGTYLLGSLFFSAKIALKSGGRFLAILPIVFGCLHFGYGIGFLHGLFNQIILRKLKPWKK